MEMDFSLGNDKDSKLATGSYYIYFLRENESRSVHELGRGLNNLFNGFAIEIKENNAF
jgi:hypothetical protein